MTKLNEKREKDSLAALTEAMNALAENGKLKNVKCCEKTTLTAQKDCIECYKNLQLFLDQVSSAYKNYAVTFNQMLEIKEKLR